MARGQHERQRLLGLAADHILTSGAVDTSLSELARRMGSNNRMLLYYFGSKEELVDEAVLTAFARFPRVYGMIDRLRESREPLPERLQHAWEDIAAEENLPFSRLFFERFGAALHHPEHNQRYLERMSGQWATRVRSVLAETGLEPERAHELAAGIVALWRGLQFALLSGVAREELDATHRRFITSVLTSATAHPIEDLPA